MFKISFGDTKDTTNIPSLVYQNKKVIVKITFFIKWNWYRVYYDNNIRFGERNREIRLTLLKLLGGRLI